MIRFILHFGKRTYIMHIPAEGNILGLTSHEERRQLNISIYNTMLAYIFLKLEEFENMAE